MIERRGDFINVRHILIQPKVSLTDLNKAKIMLDSIAGLVASGKMPFDQAVVRFSDDPSKNNGGLLINPVTGNSRFKIEELDPKVFFAIDKLKTGEISTAIKWEERGKTLFRAYYLKTRTLPHKADLTIDYAYVQQLALDRKNYDAMQDWLTVKIKSTFIYIAEPYRNCEFERVWILQDKEQ
jgi:peptidyl-prolyl cis-trans isomerase SurA